jgi:hypothetical protein
MTNITCLLSSSVIGSENSLFNSEHIFTGGSMKKKLAFLLSVVFVFSVSILLANVQIMNFTLNGKKVHHVMRNGQKVNSCNYCHVTAKIPKKKLGYLPGQPKFATLKNMPTCAGSTCHH